MLRRAFVCLVLLLAASAPADVRLSDTFSLRGGARAYWSSAYMSSTGAWTYDAPVLEQYCDLTLDAGPYGSLTTDAWLFSDRTKGPTTTEYPFFSLGLGVRF